MKKLLSEKEYGGIIENLCKDYIADNQISKETYSSHSVKRGLRNDDGTGVMAGLTRICRVHGYMMEDGEKVADEGRLIYRGIDVDEIVEGSIESGTYSFEETIWLLLFGKLPNKEEYDMLIDMLNADRELPKYFVEDVLMRNSSTNIMNKLASAVLALYSYDDDPEDLSLENNIRESLSIIARLPVIMAYAFQVIKRSHYNESMSFHPLKKGDSTAQAILRAVRKDEDFTEEEARLLDLCLTLHAEHGGGNNSTFTTRVLSSSDTDIYSAIAGAIGSLKGFKHGGANIKVDEMMKCIMDGLNDWENEEEISEFLTKILEKKEGDGSGLIYGMGHAIYTLSDPRAIILKSYAKSLAEKKGYEKRFALYERIEQISKEVYAKVKGNGKVISANVDFYSGLVYEMLGIPHDVYTSLFAVARIPGWCAHRIEEMTTGKRIIRPAYRALPTNLKYKKISER